MPYINVLFNLLVGASIAVSGIPGSAAADTSGILATVATSPSAVYNDVPTTVPTVPFYSQFRDIRSAEWQKLGCGIASLAMIIESYHPGAVSVNVLLKEGIVSGAYLKNAGWKHKDLALLAGRYNLKGSSYDLSRLGMTAAFAQFKKFLKEGPVIASVYYEFDPKSTIPHMVVINGMEGGYIYYNDPAGLTAGKEISVADFMKGWKKKFIVVRPYEKARLANTSPVGRTF